MELKTFEQRQEERDEWLKSQVDSVKSTFPGELHELLERMMRLAHLRGGEEQTEYFAQMFREMSPNKSNT